MNFSQGVEHEYLRAIPCVYFDFKELLACVVIGTLVCEFHRYLI